MSDIPWALVFLGGIALLAASRRGGGNGNGNGDNGGDQTDVTDTGEAWVYDDGRTPRVDVSVFTEQGIESTRQESVSRAVAYHLARASEVSNRSCRIFYDTATITTPDHLDHKAGSDALGWFDDYVRGAPSRATSTDSNVLVSDERRTGRAWLGGNACVASGGTLAWADDIFAYSEFQRGINPDLDPDARDFWPHSLHVIFHEVLHNLDMSHADNGCVWQDREGHEDPFVTPMCNIEGPESNLCGEDSDLSTYTNHWLAFSECSQQNWNVSSASISTLDTGRGVMVE